MRIPIEIIKQAGCNVFNVTMEELYGKRGSRVAHAARKAIYMIARDNGYRYTEIATALFKDRASVYYGIQDGEILEEESSDFAGLLKACRDEVYAKRPKTPFYTKDGKCYTNSYDVVLYLAMMNATEIIQENPFDVTYPIQSVG